MRLRQVCLLLLTVPGLVRGTGWSLHICRHELLGIAGSCAARVEPGCCSREARAPRARMAETADPCGACCIVIRTSAEPPASTVQPLAEEWTRAQDAALIFALPSLVPLAPTPAVRPSRSPPGPPSPPGRCTPLPLRI